MADEIFENDTFVLLSKDAKKLEDLITDGGGVVARSINKRVTLVVCDDLKAYSDDVKKAGDQKTPIVKEAFITDSVAKKERLKPESYKPTAGGDDDESGPSAKKQKLSVDNSVLAANSEWTGVCITKDDTYVFKMVIKSRNDDDFEGTINWPSVGNALTKCKGKIEESKVAFEEYEAINGEDEVELPQFYNGVLSGTNLSGKMKDSTGEESSFKLDLYKKRQPKPLDMPFLTAGSQFKGVHTLVYPLVLTVTKRANDGAVGGNIVWPTADNTKTRFEGKIIKNDEIQLDEVEHLSGDGVDIPVKYEGKIAGDVFSGTYVAPNTNSKGNFKLEKQK